MEQGHETHKLTLEALWSGIWPSFLAWAQANDKAIDVMVKEVVKQIVDGFKEDAVEKINDVLHILLPKISNLLDLMATFDKETAVENPNFAYWRQYMDLVSILLRFTRAARDGNWALYLSSFAEMLPWFALYDHVHYTRWGTVFLADMKQLHEVAPEVYEGFTEGDFVVKETKHNFNQIPDDQGLEHVNRMGKVAGGLVGITRNDTARDRWSLTYNERAKLSEDTRAMFGIAADADDDEFIHKDSGPTRMRRDCNDVLKIKAQFERFAHDSSQLLTLTTGEIASDDVKQDLLNAKANGKEMLTQFVTDRLITKTVSLIQ